MYVRYLKILTIITIRALTQYNLGKYRRVDISVMHTVNSVYLLLQCLCGSNTEDRHNKNCKHVALYICQKHIWLYVTGSLLFKTVPSLCVCEIKAEWCIGSNS